jgi:hypothetical protein
VVPARGRAVVKTDLSIAIPPSTYARVAPRSGLAVKHFIDTGAGVVDEDYRGNIGVVLFNHSDVDFPGDARVGRLPAGCCRARRQGMRCCELGRSRLHGRGELSAAAAGGGSQGCDDSALTWLPMSAAQCGKATAWRSLSSSAS